jgi:glycosyltransferase involved in cell wall biosynthesis
MRVLFALPGLHRVDRGAEIAFISVANELAKAGDTVTLIGSGQDRPGAPYRFLHALSAVREQFESFPSMPVLRNEYAYEEFTFLPGLLRQYRPADYDVTVTCSYPFTNWVLRRPTLGHSRPPHVFVTQNGDWPAYANNSEYRYFGCEGLVCTNPDIYERNKNRWRCQVIPNGVDCVRFTPGAAQRHEFNLPEGRLIVLMVSALISSKRVELGIEAVHRIPNAHLFVAGDGPLRQTVDEAGARLLPGRFTRVSVTPDRMPAVYRAADIFLHLSKDEPFGNVFIEAMACGKPVVAQDSPRVRWIVGDDEFLFGNDDAAEIAECIQRAANDPLTRGPLRAKKAEAFSWTKVGEQYRSFLQQVVSSASS